MSFDKLMYGWQVWGPAGVGWCLAMKAFGIMPDFPYMLVLDWRFWLLYVSFAVFFKGEDIMDAINKARGKPTKPV